MNKTYVTASELADYVYCQCCWLDKREENQELTPEMEKGIQEHNTFSRQSKIYTLARRATILFILISLILFLTQTILVFVYHTTLW